MHKTLQHPETKDEITVSTVSDGGKNAVLLVSGKISSPKKAVVFDIMDLSSMSGNPKSIRMDSISYMIETGLKCLLRYRDHPYLIPIEGRGKCDLGVAGGIQGQEIDLSLKGSGAFFLVLDISKN